MQKKLRSVSSQILLYTSVDGETKVEVKLENETVWLTQAQMSELFQKDQRTISEHVNNIYKEGELIKDETIGSTGNSGNSKAKP